MYGIQCQMCGKFETIASVKGWAVIHEINGGGYGLDKGDTIAHVCPTCLDMFIKSKIIN